MINFSLRKNFLSFRFSDFQIRFEERRSVITVKMIVADLEGSCGKRKLTSGTARRENLFSPSRFTLPFPRKLQLPTPGFCVHPCRVIVKFVTLFFIREMDFITAQSFKYINLRGYMQTVARGIVIIFGV